MRKFNKIICTAVAAVMIVSVPVQAGVKINFNTAQKQVVQTVKFGNLNDIIRYINSCLKGYKIEYKTITQTTTQVTTQTVTESTTESTTTSIQTTSAPTTQIITVTQKHTEKEPTTTIQTTQITTKPTTRHTTSTTTTETLTETTTRAVATTNTADSSVQQQILDLINKERVKNGLGTLTLDTSLSRVAQAKAEDMYRNNYFSHTSPTYGSPFDMMKQFGVTYRTAGENIAKGQKNPQAVMTAWMNSSGHRANILNGNFTKLGVGYVYNNGSPYWVQQFIG